MSWLRANWKNVLVAVAVVVTVSSMLARARALALHEAAMARADTLAAENAELEQQERRVVVANEELRDSLEEERALRQQDRERRARERAEDDRRIALATQRAQSLEGLIRARLDAVGDSLFTEYVADWEARDAARVRIIDSLEEDVASLEEDVRSVSAELDAERVLSVLRARGWATSRAEVGEVRAAEAALLDAVAPSFFTRIFENWETHIVFGAFAVGAWEFIRR